MLFEAQLVDSVCVKQLPEEKGGSYLRLMVVRALSPQLDIHMATPRLSTEQTVVQYISQPAAAASLLDLRRHKWTCLHYHVLSAQYQVSDEEQVAV